MVQTWSKELLAILNVTLVLKGGQPAVGLVVANHVSWLDIYVAHALEPVTFIAKADIAKWPVVGALVTASRTLYIERGSRQAIRGVVQAVHARFDAGERVMFFPEGTTNDGIHILPFHGNLIQAALDAPCPVTPVGIRYLDAVSGTRSLAPAYVDDDTLLSSVWRTLRQGRLLAEVSVGDPQLVGGRDRRQWAHDLRKAVVRLAS